ESHWLRVPVALTITGQPPLQQPPSNPTVCISAAPSVVIQYLFSAVIAKVQLRMDVLFKSINVRDLLPTHDLDDSSPLSAPDLRLLIDRLDAHSEQIKSKVRNYILSHQSHFSQLLSLSSDSVSHSTSIASQLDSLLSLLSDDPTDGEIKRTLDQIRVSVKDLNAKKAQLMIVKVIASLSERLEEARELVRSGQFVQAAKLLVELKAALRVGEEEESEKEVVVYCLLRKEWLDLFEEIQDMLVKFMVSAVRFDQKSERFLVLHCPSIGGADNVELPTALEAMDILGILHYGLARTADLFIKHAMTPATNLKSRISFVEESNESHGQWEAASLKIVPCSDTKNERMYGEAIFSRLADIVKFIYKFVCLQNGSWMSSFGKLSWPRMSELVISNFLTKIVPDDASKLPDFQRIIIISSEFETTLKEMKFISASDKNDERLSSFADNVEVHFALRKKIEILGTARKFILQCDYTFPQEFRSKESYSRDSASTDHVVDLIFSSERCVVSAAASQLMELVHQTLKDVCLSSPRVALEFYHAARDVLLLYEAVVPVKLERQLDGINQVAVLLHNDCLFLSEEILGLAFEYRPDFPNSIKEHAVFADIAPRLQLLAEAVLQKHIQVVIFNLKEAIDGADGFQNTHQMQQYESAKFSMDQVVFILEKVRLLWEPILLPPTYKRCMCMVLDSVFSKISREILLLDDIAAEETLQLQRLIFLLIENLSTLLESLSAINVNKSSDESYPDPLDVQIPSIRKLQKLADMLDMPLKTITEGWEIGDLLTCGFALSEVVDFIKAIFTDSPLRKDCLWRIQNTYF
ncbi:hypothetical protein V2J09_020822, partial [Rumex salicifolius]